MIQPNNFYSKSNLFFMVFYRVTAVNRPKRCIQISIQYRKIYKYFDDNDKNLHFAALRMPN